jgi:hypothetical protein
MGWRVAVALCLIGLPALAAEPSCDGLLGEAEHRLGVPSGLLQAVALTESGRIEAETGRAVSWPWTIASGNDFSYFAPDKASAIAMVERLLAEGRSNIDVGCMQVNLKYHSDAFADLEAAFDPTRNVEYGARFLVALRDETDSWERAVERYHSADPVLGPDYRARVFDRWEEIRSGKKAAPGGRGLPEVLRPVPIDDGGPRLFAWIAPRWHLGPAQLGISLWADHPAAPLLLRGAPSPAIVNKK